MDAVVNLKREPRLREEFEHAHVHNNTALIDRRTTWGNPFRVGRDGTLMRLRRRRLQDFW